MSGPVELVIAAFNEEDKADTVLETLKDFQRQEMISVVNAAVMKKDMDGKITLKETQDVDSKRGALFGAIAGGIVGLLGGPVGVVVGAAAGAATGGVAAHKMDMGFPDDTLQELQEALKPGSSAILALIEHEWVERLTQELEKLGAALFKQVLKDEITTQLDDAPAEDQAAEDGAQE